MPTLDFANAVFCALATAKGKGERMSQIPNTKAYREWAEGVLSGQVVASSKAGAQVAIELMDYIEALERLVDSAAGEIDCIGYPGAHEALNAARENEERRRKDRA